MEKKPIGSTSLKGKKILIVDDSPDNRVIINLFLKHAGGEVFEAANGAEALEMALESEFDIVLMDIQMPVLDGYQTMLKLRDASYSKPVIALTANALKEERDRCLSAGFKHYLTKPINRENLLRTVSDLVNVPA